MGPGLKKLVETTVQPELAIGRMIADHRLRRYSDRVLEAFGQEPGDTMYHVMNAITRTANGLEDPEARERLQRVGGAITDEANSERCTLCYQTLRN